MLGGNVVWEAWKQAFETPWHVDQVSPEARAAVPADGDLRNDVPFRGWAEPRAAAHGNRHRQDLHRLSTHLEANERWSP